MAATRKKTATKRSSTAGKTTKRAKAKRSVEVMDDVMMEEVTSSTIDTSSVKKISTKTKLAVLLALVVIGSVLYLSRGYFIAATVNGELLYRPSVIGELEKRFGKQTLDSLVSDALINQEAKKNNITVSSEELDAEVKTIEDSVKAQGQDLDTLLTIQGMTRDELKKQVRTQKLVEKILGAKIEPTEAEVKDYMDKNKDLLPKDKKPDEIKTQVTQQLKQQKLGAEFQTWIADLKLNANIKYYVTY